MSVLSLILAGGSGSNLSVLCEQRAKPALPFGGFYRIIDFPLSNLVNSGLDRVAVLTQYQPHSLVRHLGDGGPWDLKHRASGGLKIWQPFLSRSSDQGWYKGTADAVYQNRKLIQEDGSDTLLILAGDHVYNQNYRDLIDFHRAKGADLTIAVTNVPDQDVSQYGILSTGPGFKITSFVEKPETSVSSLASMGIYVFNTQFLLGELEIDARDLNSAHDFGRNIVPKVVEMGRAFAYPFLGYWADIGSIQTYWAAGMALLEEKPALDLHYLHSAIHTRSEDRPPVKCSLSGEISNSLVSNGCVIAGKVVHSILSPGVRVEEGAIVRDSIIMHDSIIKSGAVVEGCILDKNVVVGPDSHLGVGGKGTPNALEPGILFAGITLVGKGAHIPADMRIGKNCRIDPGTDHSDYISGEVPAGSTVSKKMKAPGEN